MKVLQDAASQSLSMRREDVYAESYNPFLDQCSVRTMRFSWDAKPVLEKRYFFLKHNHFSEAFNDAWTHDILLRALSRDFPDQSYPIGLCRLPVELGVACIHCLEVLRDRQQSSTHDRREQPVRSWSLCLLNGTTFDLYVLSRSILLPVWNASYTQKIPVGVAIAIFGVSLALAKRISSDSQNNLIILFLLQLADYVPETLRTATALSVMRPQETDLHLLLAAMMVQFVVYMGSVCAIFMPSAQLLKLLQAWMLTGFFMTSLVHDTREALWHPSKSDYSPYLPALRVGLWTVFLGLDLFILRRQYNALSQNTVEVQDPVSDQRTVKDQRPSQPAAAQTPPLVQPLLFSEAATSTQLPVSESAFADPPAPLTRPKTYDELFAEEREKSRLRSLALENKIRGALRVQQAASSSAQGLHVASAGSFFTPAASSFMGNHTTPTPTSSDISAADDVGSSSSRSLRPSA